MNVSLRQLRVFLAVAQDHHFSRAGEALGLTQSAVSRSITELEQALGLQLLHRTTREVALTDAGRLLQAHVARILEDLESCLLEVQGLATQHQGRVSVASSPTLSAHLLPQCIARCEQRHPGLQLQLLDRIQSDVLHSVRSSEVEFGVVIDPMSCEDLSREVILTEPFCLVLRPDHPLARAAQVDWAALDGLPLVLLDQASGSRRLIDAALLAHGAAARVVQEVGHTTTIFSMVQAGLGLTVVPQLAVPGAWFDVPGNPAGPPKDQPMLAARRITPVVQREIMLVHRKQRTLSPLALQVWGLIREVAAEMAPGSLRRTR
ncbi:MAG: LysR family transcriptional regulator [Proteobacteria bacterium]|nr:LysR family transcriptional regulator [Pseudomonadota bacterium]